MNVHYFYRGLSGSDVPQWPLALQQALGRRLGPWLERHGAATAPVHVVLQRQAPHGFRAMAHVYLPGKRIVAVTVEQEELMALAQHLAKALFQEVKRHFARLQVQDQYKRRVRRERLRQLKTQVTEQVIRPQAQGMLVSLLPQVEVILRREIAYLRAAGDLPKDDPSLHDVVDEAFLVTQAAWQPDWSREQAFRHLLRQGFHILDRERRASRHYGQTVPLEMPVEWHEPKDEAEAMVEEEFYAFYQPDDTLCLADVLSVKEPLPALLELGPGPGLSLAQTGEQAYALDVLKDLPVLWRRAFQLVHLDGLTLEAVADILDQPESQVKLGLERAESFVLARLQDAGIVREGDTLPDLAQLASPPASS